MQQGASYISGSVGRASDRTDLQENRNLNPGGLNLAVEPDLFKSTVILA